MDNKNSSGAPRPRILVVHESRIMRASITRHIKQQYDCLEATEFEAGWQLLQADPAIEVVLVDLSLPREEGVAFLARVTSSEIARVAATPVIMITSEDGHTGNSVEESRQRALKAGAVDFVGKATTGAETLARIRVAQRVGALRRALADQQISSGASLPIDPSAGLMTQEYLEVAGQQAFAFALRHHTELAALAIGIDALGAVDQRLGVLLAPTISRELSVVMSRCLRREDTLVALDTGRFLALLPGLSVEALGELVDKMQAKLAATVMRYQGEVIQVTVSVGASSLASDASADVKRLAELAQRRLIEAMSLGAGQFVGAAPVPPAAEPALPINEGSVDAALALLQERKPEAVLPQLPVLAAKLTPLLRLIEREFQMNFKLSRLKERTSSAGKKPVVET